MARRQRRATDSEGASDDKPEKGTKLVDTPKPADVQNSGTKKPTWVKYFGWGIAACFIALIVIGTMRIFNPPKPEELATVRYVVNPSEIPKDAQVQRVVFEWNPAGKFYLTSSIVLEEGDYILERSNGLIHWTSDPIADKRGYLQVTPCGVDDLMPFQLKSKTQMNLYLAKEASVACLIGVVGPRPVFDDETGIAWVRGGSRHFGMRSECAVQVTKLPKGKNYLSMAVNDLWTVGDMANNVGTWYIEVQVFRPKKA